MKRVIELTVWAGLLATTTLAAAQSRPQTPPPPPPGVAPQPVGRGTEPTATAPASPASSAPRPAQTTPAGAGTGAARPAGTASPAAEPAAQPSGPVAVTGPATEPVPTEAQLGVPIFPGARFLRSFDAGQGQRYYLFGATAAFGELVLYYRTQLKERGDLVYDEPPVHMFEVGRFREETMAFPPGVTIKDYTWGGKPGYLVPTPGATPSHYPTVIQIVPVTAR